MKTFKTLMACSFTLLLFSCAANDSMTAKTAPRKDGTKVLFQDPMMKDWRKNWFLDGRNAVLEHRPGGLAYMTEASKKDKRVDRAAFDAQHAVLWTRKEFKGDIRISYTFTKLPGCSWQMLLYIQAQGIGKEPYVKDIHAWRDLRKVALMSQYYNHMNLIALSMRDPIRCKRYPWKYVIDPKTNKKIYNTEFKPRAVKEKLAIGTEYKLVAEKRKKSLRLTVKETATGRTMVDHTWDISQEQILQGMDPKYIEEGRIGIRFMGGYRMIFRDFTVERLGVEINDN